jgi:outer membrane protein OmpA-like peptidoglycan-associated protein
MNKLTLLFLATICSLQGFSQGYNPDKVNKKASGLYSKGIEVAESGRYRDAIVLMDQAIAADNNFVDAYLSKAGLYGEMKEYQGAVDNYEIAFKKDSAYTQDYRLPYSINLAGLGQFNKALDAIQVFIKDTTLNPKSLQAAEYRKNTFMFALAQQKRHGRDYSFHPVNLGDSVNSKDSEYYPSVTLDGKTLVFTRRLGGFNEDFFESTKNGDHWSAATPLDGRINTEQNEGAQNISQDGKWLIFTGCNRPDGNGECDLYISLKTKDGWSEPQNLGRSINTEFWESAPSLSPDKRDLYFASRRPGGFGGIDIYVSHRLPNGRWDIPENMGPEINTVGDESCPFIHADNNTLYFTSNGHLGYGGDDLFLVRKDGKGGWGPVENLGFPINTIENEGSLVVAADGKTAYYASDRSDSRGGLDIYAFDLREDVRPSRTLWVQGKVYDRKTKEGLPSAVELTDLSTGQLVSKVQTDESGDYLVTLPVGKDWAFTVNRRNYLFYSGNFNLSASTPDSTYRMDIPLQPIETDAVVTLNNIFFESGNFTLRAESYTELDKIVQLLNDNPTLRIRINGYTDNVGKAADNLALSNARAKSVTSYLVSKGVAAARLSAQGFGASKPVADNASEEGRARNRRTELEVISK